MSGTLLPGVTGVLALADGRVLQGIGCGAEGKAVGEVCFNTAMSGYQEILTDPSYMAQIIAFTFPHIGNVGTNGEDVEQISGAAATAARGAIFRDAPTDPANWRADSDLSGWLRRRGVVGLCGVDTRALTKSIREKGMPHGVIAHSPDGRFDLPALIAEARAWEGIVGADLAKEASCLQPFVWEEGLWGWPEGYARDVKPKYEVVVVDYGVKRNILRALTSVGARATVVPATTTAEEILARKPDGVLLSNGPGDPAATGEYAVPEIRKLV
ncbi:MAG TPA: carbamoyl-phosphate synthase domain-containing protein, partial [Caulobacteraceae bacterium]|nr:carbamoyl-phosphate synthase domain-containing protein [Caulobacteraceae bacterium]